MHEWPRKPVRELCTLIVDCVNRTAPVVERATPYRMIRTTNVRDGRIDLGECRCVEEATFERWTRRAKVLDGDVILTREAPIGEVGFANGLGSVFLGQRIMQFRPDPSKIEPRYLYYAFRSPDLQHQFGMHDGSGSVVSHIRVADCHEFKVSAPPLDQQRRVVELLGSIDDKIELNRRMNETLEAMAQAIFRDWFVDFGPVRRKLEGASDPVAIMGGLMPDPERAAELARLFPGEFGDDELPLGWKAGDLSDLATTAGESVDPTRLTEDTPYIGLEHMPRRSITLDNWEYAGKVSSQKSRFSSGQVLFGKLRPYFHKVGIAPVDGVCSTDIVVLDSRADFDRGLVACCVSSDAFVAFTDLTSSGTKMPRTSWSHMKTYDLAIADAPVRRAFSGLVGPMHQKVVSSVAENRTLAKTRDYLLPRLMSGEVRVGDAVQEIAA